MSLTGKAALRKLREHFFSEAADEVRRWHTRGDTKDESMLINLIADSVARLACEGCARHAKTPKHTLRVWSPSDPDGPEHDGAWFHVDPSGQTYPCTAFDFNQCESCDCVKCEEES